MQTILYGYFQFNPRQCGVMQFGEVKQSIAIQCTEVQCCLVQSSLVSFTPVVLPRHQLIFQRTQPTKGYPVIRGWISNTGISVEQYWSDSWEDDHNYKLSYSYKKNLKFGYKHRYNEISEWWKQKLVKADRRPLKKSTPEGVIEYSPYISLKLKRVQVFLLLPNSGMSSYNSFYGKKSEIITRDSKYYKVGYSTV